MSPLSHPEHHANTQHPSRSQAHWRANLRLMLLLLSIWFIVSYLLGIVFVEPLNQMYLGGFPLGFWFAQQGAMYVFIVLIFLYAYLMDRVDRRYGVVSKSSPDSPSQASETPE